MQDPIERHRKRLTTGGVEPQLWSTDQAVFRWQSGDGGAFVDLHRRLSPKLLIRVTRSPLWHHLSKRYEVEDVVQGVWARISPTVHGEFEPSGTASLMGFLKRVSDNRMVDLLRRQGARKRGNGRTPDSLDTQAAFNAVPRPGRSHAETPTSDARASKLQAIARGELSEGEFLAWELIEIQGYTAHEAGLAMGGAWGDWPFRSGPLEARPVKACGEARREQVLMIRTPTHLLAFRRAESLWNRSAVAVAIMDDWDPQAASLDSEVL